MVARIRQESAFAMLLRCVSMFYVSPFETVNGMVVIWSKLVNKKINTINNKKQLNI